MSLAGSPLTNWAGNVHFAAKRVHRPESLEELRGIVAGADRVRAVGSGHSFNLVADTEHDLVRLDGLPGPIEIDPSGTTVRVGAGVRYAEVAAALDKAGFALSNLASLPHISVAGSCATGTHGSGDGQPGLAAAVVAQELLGPDGELVRFGRDTHPDVFPGTVVALGALGIVTRLTLAIEPAFTVAQRVRLDAPLDEIAADLDGVFGAAYSVSAFTDWRSGTAAVWLKDRTDRPGTGWSGGRAATGHVHPIPGISPEPSTPQLGLPGPWHERLPHFRSDFTPSAGDELQSELFLARDRAPEAISALRDLGHLIAPLLHISEIRTVRADDLWLSPSHGRDSVTFHFTWIKDTPAVLPVLAAVEERLAPLGARPHWGKLTMLKPADVIARYDRAPDFARLARELDPAGKFRNAFTGALFPLGS